MLYNCVSQVCLSYFKQVTVAAEHDLYYFAILVSSKAVVWFAFIMNYQEDEWIFCLLMYFRDLLLNDYLVLSSHEGVNQEDVEHRNNLLKNLFFDQTVSISHWHKHRMLKIVVELYLYTAIVDQGFWMSLERAIEHIVCKGGASLGGLVRVGWDFEGKDSHVLLKTVEELFIDIWQELHLWLRGGIQLCLIEGHWSLILISWIGLHHLNATVIIRSMIIELHGDVLLLFGLIANQRQWHEERACHDDHGEKVCVWVV